MRNRRPLMTVLTIRFPTAAAFFAAWQADPPDGGLFIPTTRPLARDAPIVVEIGGRMLGEHVFLRATVYSTRPAVPHLGQRAGVVAAFTHEEREAVAYVLAVARGERQPHRRRKSPRLPVSLVARYRQVGQADWHEAEVIDVSTGGLALRAEEPPPVAARLVVQLPVPGAMEGLELAGEVVFLAPAHGRVGMKFEWHGVSGVRRVREAMRRLRAA